MRAAVEPQRVPQGGRALWLAPIVLAIVFGAASSSLATPPRARSALPMTESPWVGRWLLHSPNHGSYQATEYRFGADGTLALTGSIDTTHEGRWSEHRMIRWVVRGRRSCRFGEHWATTDRVERIRIEGICNDGRRRPIELEIRREAFAAAFPSGAPRGITVGSQRGFRIAHGFDTELERCGRNPDEACDRIQRRAGARTYAPTDFDADGRWIPPPRP